MQNITKNRIHSIDIIRGLIMVIMALDHTRDFFHFPSSPLNMQTTTVVLFFTRWITHFCAPSFIFLSGVSVFLAGQRRTKNELSKFLLTRGLWLIVSDLLIMSFLFTFDLQYHILVLEVLWVTGFGMIVLALLIRTSLPVIATIALAIIFGHNLLNYVTLPKTGFGGSVLTLLFSAFGSLIPIGGDRIIAGLYAAIPWMGPILLGYVFGSLYQTGFDIKKRQKILLLSGISFITLFIILMPSTPPMKIQNRAMQNRSARPGPGFLRTDIHWRQLLRKPYILPIKKDHLMPAPGVRVCGYFSKKV
jgi:uncharacterized membrane protein